jgi:hypothetical protein
VLGHDAEAHDLDDRIVNALAEARVALPGAQAVLGFQLITVFMDRFAELTPSVKAVHVTALCLTALAILLLMTPAAYHRLVERGENTEHFHGVIGHFVIGGLVPLAMGMCGELFVVVRAAGGAPALAGSAALAMGLVFAGLWFGWALVAHAGRSPRVSQRSPRP